MVRYMAVPHLVMYLKRRAVMSLRQPRCWQWQYRAQHDGTGLELMPRPFDTASNGKAELICAVQA